jgi:hypothetical protein
MRTVQGEIAAVSTIKLPMRSRDRYIVITGEELSTDHLARKLQFINGIIY